LLRCEQLESRTVLAAISPLGNLPFVGLRPLGNIAVYANIPAATPPTVAKAASANLNSAGDITATTAALSVLGNDAQGESTLVYNWRVTSVPAGGSARFTANGTNAAKKDTVTFSEAGVYGIAVTIVDGAGLSVASSVKVTVVQTVTGMNLYNGKTLVSPSTQLNVTGTSQAVSATGLDQFGNAVAVQPSITWTAKSVPTGAATPQFTVSGSLTAVKFSAAGTYCLTVKQSDAFGNSVTKSIVVVVGQVAAGATTGTPLTVTGTSQQLPAPSFVDQFAKPITASLAGIVWTATTLPSGAPAPTLVTANANTTVTFGMAGTYVLKAQPSNSTASFTVSVTVKQTLTTILVTPGTASIHSGATQQFTAQGLDQFKQAMATPPTFTWSASSGTISSAGLFTAPNSAGTDSIAAKSGSITGSSSVTVTAPAPSPSPNPAPGGLKDPVLASLVQKLDADGSLSRADMIQILTSVGAGGTVSATDFSDLKTILTDAAQYNMPSYVQVLAGDVINGNVANAHYQGTLLGNMAAGGSTTQLDDLVDKWFFGTDLPALTDSSLTYMKASGSLFPVTPSNKDEFQGELGDCYFISSLGTIADSNPAAVENMFVNNGDGTFTVRFYANGTADYVTVNSSLPTYYGTLAYADYGFNASSAGNSLWIPLAEKAYAQWNETSKEGRDGSNTYSSIEGGWMADVDAQILGHSATSCGVTSSTEQAMISALSAGEAVTIGTDVSSNSNDTLPGGLYGSHAYTVLNYSASTGVFTLYNPWGCDQPNTLSWSQLESTCDGFVVAITTGSAPISGANLHAPVASAVAQVAATTSGAATSLSAATNLAAAIAAGNTVLADETGSSASPSVTDNGSGNHQEAIYSNRPSLDTAAQTSRQPVAVGVDTVLANEELGRFFVA